MGKQPVVRRLMLGLTVAAFLGLYLLLAQRSPERRLHAGPLPRSDAAGSGHDQRAPATLRCQWKLYQAVALQDIPAMRQLLEDGADPNERCSCGWRPLHAAAALGDVAAVELLLRYGADVTARADNGCTPLHTGCRSPEVAGILILHGADVAAKRRNGRTPLHAASRVSTDGESSVALLVAAGAPVNAVDDYGDTPLLLAVRDGEPLPDIVHTLISAGADVNVVSDDGHTALSLAAQQNLPAVAALLRAHGAVMGPTPRPAHEGRRSAGPTR